jgi:Putative DNA-binding domain
MTREAERQRLLLAALWRDAGATLAVAAHLHPSVHGADAGLAAYRSNAGAVAERALASCYPTLAALVGEESFAALARDFWQQHPPTRGDLGEWGGSLANFVDASPQLANEPFLADVARLEWQAHLASRAADDEGHALDLAPLAEHDASRVHFTLRAGAALVESTWPIVAIWRAHQADSAGADRFAAVRAAFAAGRGDAAWVRREGLAVCVDALDDAMTRFTRALLARRSLAEALDLSGAAFAFDQWLAQALAGRWIATIDIEGPHP